MVSFVCRQPFFEAELGVGQQVDVADCGEDGEFFGPNSRESRVLVRVRPDELLDDAKVAFAADKKVLF